VFLAQLLKKYESRFSQINKCENFLAKKIILEDFWVEIHRKE